MTRDAMREIRCSHISQVPSRGRIVVVAQSKAPGPGPAVPGPPQLHGRAAGGRGPGLPVSCLVIAFLDTARKETL